VPAITVTKNRSGFGLFGYQVSWNLSVAYNKGSCFDNITTSIVDTYPLNFTVVDNATGVVNPVAHTITWTNQLISSGVPWQKSVRFLVSSQPCDCGQVFTNTLDVVQTSDCCGCPLTGRASANILVECYGGIVASSTKTATPNPQQNCDNITYITTYTFGNVGATAWDNLTFKEQGNNSQTFPGGSDNGTVTFIVNGGLPITHDLTLGSPLNLGFLSPALADNTTLQSPIPASNCYRYFRGLV